MSGLFSQRENESYKLIQEMSDIRILPIQFNCKLLYQSKSEYVRMGNILILYPRHTRGQMSRIAVGMEVLSTFLDLRSAF